MPTAHSMCSASECSSMVIYISTCMFGSHTHTHTPTDSPTRQGNPLPPPPQQYIGREGPSYAVYTRPSSPPPVGFEPSEWTDVVCVWVCCGAEGGRPGVIDIQSTHNNNKKLWCHQFVDKKTIKNNMTYKVQLSDFNESRRGISILKSEEWFKDQKLNGTSLVYCTLHS